MGPESALEEISRRRRLERRPREGGIGPDRLVEERLRNWRDERVESEGGNVERLRKVLGSESEMTLWSGEHVMNFHEHGVGLEGVQLEKRDEFDGGMRERSACPSGESAVRVRDTKENTMWRRRRRTI